MFRFDNTKCHRMPAHFGGYDYVAEGTCYHDTVTVSFSYATEKKLLEAHIPEAFELVRPELCIAFTQCRKVDWMAGSSYNLVTVSAPVRFNGARDHVEAPYVLVIWENKTAPILTGREETGFPKIYADIEDLHSFSENYFTNVSFEGNTFLRLHFSDAVPFAEQEIARMKNLPMDAIGWRYIPKVGGPGADLSQPILFPQECEVARAWAGKGAVQWTELSWLQNPGQAHIIKALAGLPMLETGPARMVEGAVTLKASLARVLE